MRGRGTAPRPRHPARSSPSRAGSAGDWMNYLFDVVAPLTGSWIYFTLRAITARGREMREQEEARAQLAASETALTVGKAATKPREVRQPGWARLSPPSSGHREFG